MTDFGYQRVPVTEKSARVREVFDSVAPRYDLMNDLMSAGLHRLWKRFAVELSGVRSGQRVLDLAGGTGDLGILLARRVGPEGEVVLSDINAAMLDHGRDRLIDRGLVRCVRYLQADAEQIPVADGSFDCVTIGFGLRNVTDKQRALNEIRRVLRPGGRALVLEFSEVKPDWFKPVYDFHSFQILPRLGRLFAGDSDSYQYLAESIRKHPPQDELKSMMETAGLSRCSYRNLSAGIVAIHSGYAV
ncbi:MAG: bifunctional demethylmenaquinone methyltransferase/2-methoxy-6-polyprenyl-1,4-benzoquinol methylase UbiE [Gammaproteobacteria bacterium]|nr:bifunctional demethylmenaquinone methyltransferase/2-methoxy-6-polyprenyl-1,4-benzoquinol methylase UbiE [Gammaproteobacteria bacterium]